MLKNVEFEVQYGAEVNENFQNSDGWTCTLTYWGRGIEIPFYMGKGHHGAEPELNDVLSAMFRDADALEMSFQEFCGEFGYDDDSIKAFKTYNACVANAKDLQYLLDGDYESIRDEVEAVMS